MNLTEIHKEDYENKRVDGRNGSLASFSPTKQGTPVNAINIINIWDKQSFQISISYTCIDQISRALLFHFLENQDIAKKPNVWE